jgi:hypothetical protein
MKHSAVVIFAHGTKYGMLAKSFVGNYATFYSCPLNYCL